MRILRKKLKVVKSCYNMGVIKSLFEKWSCKHQWEMVAKTSYIDGVEYLFICQKCGKMKKKWI